MDGLNQLTAAGQVVNIGGRDYRLGPLTLDDYGEIENRHPRFFDKKTRNCL